MRRIGAIVSASVSAPVPPGPPGATAGLLGFPALSRVERTLPWLAFTVPALVTTLRATSTPAWRDDLAIVRGLGLVPVGGEGSVSSVATQFAVLLPVGGRLLRASLVSALFLAVASVLVYFVARRVLRANAETPTLLAPLALAAALMATLGPTWQLEGTIAGGATLAASLALGGLLVRPLRRPARRSAANPVPSLAGDVRVWLGFGAVVGAAAMESHAAGVALLAAVAVQAGLIGDLPPWRAIVAFATGLAVMVGFFLVPMVLRPLSDRSFVDLGLSLSTQGLSDMDAAAERGSAFGAWLRDVGGVSVALACAGAVWGALRERTRWVVGPLLVFVAFDAVFPASRGGILAADGLASVRLLAVAAVSISASLAVQTLVLALQRATLPMARPAAVLLVLLNLVLVLVASEGSAHATDQRARRGADVWTDEALGGLPPDGLLLVRSQAVAWRLWAARVVRGDRPDLVVVPTSLLERAGVAERLVDQEPALAQLVREVAISGRPTEYALSTLADTRPLFVELDPSWDRRLVAHLSPEPLWLAYVPHAVGRSDRAAALDRGRAALLRAIDAASSPGRRDEATLAMLGLRAREQAFALAAVGDRTSATTMLATLRSIQPEDPFARDLEGRLSKHERGRMDMTGLLD